MGLVVLGMIWKAQTVLSEGSKLAFQIIPKTTSAQSGVEARKGEAMLRTQTLSKDHLFNFATQNLNLNNPASLLIFFWFCKAAPEKGITENN